jgi:hypothetical protein
MNRLGKVKIIDFTKESTYKICERQRYVEWFFYVTHNLKSKCERQRHVEWPFYVTRNLKSKINQEERQVSIVVDHLKLGKKEWLSGAGGATAHDPTPFLRLTTMFNDDIYSMLPSSSVIYLMSTSIQVFKMETEAEVDRLRLRLTDGGWVVRTEWRLRFLS